MVSFSLDGISNITFSNCCWSILSFWKEKINNYIFLNNVRIQLNQEKNGHFWRVGTRPNW